MLDRAYFEALPEEHPHRLPTEEEIKRRRRQKREVLRFRRKWFPAESDAERQRRYDEITTGVRR